MSRVEALYVYPVKSGRGITAQRALVDRRGFRGDRRWMIVRDNGVFISQRDQPSLCLLQPELTNQGIVLTYDGHQTEIPQTLTTGPRVTVQVWRSHVEAIEYPPARSLISRAVGESARLVYMPDDAERPLGAPYAHPGDIVSFADGFPVLLASTTSLTQLEHRAGIAISMTRFRPNVVISGTEPFEEDTWQRVTLGAVRFRVAKPCDRCAVTTIDPATGEQGKEPLRTLATFRKRDNAVWFAVNLVPESLGELRVGDAVHPS